MELALCPVSLRNPGAPGEAWSVAFFHLFTVLGVALTSHDDGELTGEGVGPPGASPGPTSVPEQRVHRRRAAAPLPFRPSVLQTHETPSLSCFCG